MALSTQSEFEVVEMRRLPPHHRIARYIEYFYEGQVDVVRGKAEVPWNKPEWIMRMLQTGYVIDDEEYLANVATSEIVDLNNAARGLAEEEPIYPEKTSAPTEPDETPDAQGDDGEEEPVGEVGDVSESDAGDALSAIEDIATDA